MWRLASLGEFLSAFFVSLFFLTRAYTIRFAKYFEKEYLYGLVQFGMIMFNLGLNFGFNSLGDQVQPRINLMNTPKPKPAETWRDTCTNAPKPKPE